MVEPGKTGGKQGADGTFSGMVAAMSRLARVVGVGVAHHVTQRGNGRQFLLVTDAERAVRWDQRSSLAHSNRESTVA
jgi:hypothetical protein